MQRMLHEEKFYRYQTNAQFRVFNFLQILKHIVISILHFQQGSSIQESITTKSILLKQGA